TKDRRAAGFLRLSAAVWCTRPTVSKRRSPLSRPYYPRSKISHPQGCLSEQTFAQAHKKQMRFTVVSALGQKQTFAVQKCMSALPPIATSIAFFGMFALGQKRTSRVYSITSLALARSDSGTVRPQQRVMPNFLEHGFTSAPPSNRSSIRLVSDLALSYS